MSLAWDDVQLFLAVAEAGSLSGAARRLQVGQPTVSRRLADLEYRLGAQLFQRRAEGAALTGAGERLLEPARRMAEWAAEVERASELGQGAGLRGVVRVTAPPGLAFDFVAPLAARVRERHPELRLEVLSAVQRLDLTRGEADLALRLQPTVSSELAVLGSFTTPNRVVVARSYAERLPRRPTLQQLDWISWAAPFEDIPPTPQLKALIPDFRPSFTSDNYLVQWRACEAGLGAMILGGPRHRLSLPMELVSLDVDLGPHRESTLHLVCAKSALALPRVRAVADLALAELQPPPPRARGAARR
ncbi:LysR family transcriptional regulator [Aggregicoccus sp. 17bor-14]|uniref:LysR family transcriptional regulator n=1 Tax=Myxococcaceae TaxID=31 RepID=UPI00129C7F2F|nr:MULTISPECIES: LysR family transcriptional regulator [Myxococcaceae]MBF5042430.1 LysR family transcriptional regulator [Simulacricoccus sp. 17bor-14]MRI88201.1 LysR family transcriptional regulator [Aggregicoccus sp. 17bor-14]